MDCVKARIDKTQEYSRCRLCCEKEKILDMSEWEDDPLGNVQEI